MSHPAARTTSPAGPAPIILEQAPTARAGGWWGLGFALLLFLSEAAVALPRTSHTTAFLSRYYADHRWPISIAQGFQLLAAVLLWQFVRALSASLAGVGRARAVRSTGLAVCLLSLQTSVPVLALALLPGLQPPVTRTLAGWTDSSDVVLFAAVAAWGFACSRAGLPGRLRSAAGVLGCVALARVVVGATGHSGLAVVAPLVFLGFVLVLSAAMVTGRTIR